MPFVIQRRDPRFGFSSYYEAVPAGGYMYAGSLRFATRFQAREMAQATLAQLPASDADLSIVELSDEDVVIHV